MPCPSCNAPVTVADVAHIDQRSEAQRARVQEGEERDAAAAAVASGGGQAGEPGSSTLAPAVKGDFGTKVRPGYEDR